MYSVEGSLYDVFSVFNMFSEKYYSGDGILANIF
jgi:hypothetical protein